MLRRTFFSLEISKIDLNWHLLTSSWKLQSVLFRFYSQSEAFDLLPLMFPSIFWIKWHFLQIQLNTISHVSPLCSLSSTEIQCLTVFSPLPAITYCCAGCWYVGVRRFLSNRLQFEYPEGCLMQDPYSERTSFLYRAEGRTELSFTSLLWTTVKKSFSYHQQLSLTVLNIGLTRM